MMKKIDAVKDELDLITLATLDFAFFLEHEDSSRRAAWSVKKADSDKQKRPAQAGR